MDMNASYNTLVKSYFPNVEIVYDRYHVQAQFGRDVLGQVRLEAARIHKQTAKDLASQGQPTLHMKALMNVLLKYCSCFSPPWVLFN